MFSLPAAPAKQSVSETITVLSGRLSSATLLEDRRAAILGLRSFAKDFPASVASGALRSLIGSLSKDGEDVDTVKVALETLLMLFNPNEDSPEASDEITLWLADEFTQRQENITLLLDFLETNDFYSRLYTLQLLTAILSNRTERTEECVFTAPLGISRLVGVLDDGREAIRNEAISLLIYLTPSSADIQKLVAFENAFDRLFSIIKLEGSIGEGGRAVEDCLILLANLLRRNASNQSLFRETSGCISHLSGFLEQACKVYVEEADLATWAQAQRNRNVYALLAVVRLFLVPGSVGTSQNQAAFWQHGLLYHALQLAFCREAEEQIRAEVRLLSMYTKFSNSGRPPNFVQALVTCADVIRGNPDLQGSFAQLKVLSPLAEETRGSDGKTSGVGVATVYVIDGLLDSTLGLHSVGEFNIRLAACECLKAYFFHHNEIRLHFLARAIEGHKSGRDETANVLTALLQPSTQASAGDPYRLWFAAVITFHLLFDNPEAKANAMSVTEGDADSGEEVVTCIQTIAGQLVAGLARGDDARVLVAYLMLLLGWLYEDLDAVNDFLGEGSHVQSLIQAVVGPSGPDELVQGLCAMLLGIVYEFSTKDSPIPRETLHPLLTTRLGRDRYADKLSKIRSHPLMRDFEVTPQKVDMSGSGRLPDVFFDATFVEFFKDNYSRAARAIDRDPGIEIPVMTNGVQKGISRELVDSLRSQLEEKQGALQDHQATLASVQRQLEQEQAEHRRTRETSSIELSRIKGANEALQRCQEDDMRKMRAEQQAKEDGYRRQLEQERRKHDEELRKVRTAHQLMENDYQRKLEQARRLAESEAERFQRRSDAEIADLRATISRLEVDLMKTNKSKTQESQAIRDEFDAKLAEQSGAAEAAAARLRDVEAKLANETDRREKSDSALRDAITARKATQGELDDLLMVFGDMEEKVSKYKSRLEALGEAVSDGEEDEGDGEGGDESEEEEGKH